MFESSKKFDLKKYQKIRKGKVSLFGISADFDWFILNIFAFLVIVFIFIFYINQINEVLNYEQEPDQEFQKSFSSEKVLKDLDSVVELLKNKKKESVNLIDENQAE